MLNVVRVKEFSVFNYNDERQMTDLACPHCKEISHDNIDEQINTWLGYYDVGEIKIIDIKYHTQLNNGQFDTSALVIYEIDHTRT